MTHSTEKPIGCTFGNSTTHKTTAIITGNAGLMDFVLLGEHLAQISDLKIESDISKDQAREIAMGKQTSHPLDVIATIDILERLIHPISPGSLVELATEKQVENFLYNGSPQIAKLGHLLRMEKVDAMLPEKSLSYHLALLGMTGTGKSNSAKVLLRQISGKVPLIVLDPHNEYEGDTLNIDAEVQDIKGIEKADVVELMKDMIPKKLEKAMYYLQAVAEQHIGQDVQAMLTVINEDSITDAKAIGKYLNQAIKIIAVRETLSKHISMAYLTKSTFIINVKGCEREFQEYIVKFIAEKILEKGKAGQNIYMMIDEVHNYIPQRGQASCKSAMLQLVREGGKFGCGVIMLSQRPADIDKGVLSQCNTKIILKLTNENDINQVRHSTEFSTKQMFDEVQKLRKGESLLVSSFIERPVFIKIDKYESK